MKLKKLGFCATIFILSTCCFAENRVGFSVGVGSCVPFYGDETAANRNTSLSDNYGRMILDLNSDCPIRLSDNVFFVLGVDSVMDFCWTGSSHYNCIDYAFLGGLKVLPGIGGLSVSVNYALGQRTDFIKSSGEAEDISGTAWGNGFDFGIEYDFSYGTGGWAPVLCFDWRRMPRGGSSVDNIIGVNCKLPIF